MSRKPPPLGDHIVAALSSVARCGDARLRIGGTSRAAADGRLAPRETVQKPSGSAELAADLSCRVRGRVDVDIGGASANGAEKVAELTSGDPL